MRIGILGGSFNPVHNEHVAIAKYVKDELSLDKILILPNGLPPHKNTCQISFDDRVRMLQAVFDNSIFEISELEKDESVKHYSFNTLTMLNEIYPHDKLYFCMGMDSLNYLDKWFKGLELIKLTNLVVVGRDGYSLDDNNAPVNDFLQENQLSYLQSDFQERIFDTKNYCILLKKCFKGVSSSKIRTEFFNFYQKYGLDANIFEHLNEFKYVRDYLDPKVIAYIQSKKLYNTI
ncbi:MAG: nicotinate (nicotinamide) nucleotide adenylyltransferase [Succinatimonas sp.]|nr:nicotinate (nicotinamide) nucleotide adenylyltransferase [Succinatimonas sp.]